MEPVLLIVGGGLALLAAVTPYLKRRVARGRGKQLEDAGLVVVDDLLGVAWARKNDVQRTLVGRTGTNLISGGTEIRVTAQVPLVTGVVRLFGARHRDAIARIEGTDAFATPFGGGALIVVCALAHPDHLMGGAPADAVVALANDAEVALSVSAILRRPNGRVERHGDDLLFITDRAMLAPQEVEVRQALDDAARALAALDRVARDLPQLEPPPSTSTDAPASSSQGSPFAVRG